MTYHIDFEPLGRRVSCTEGATIFEVARSAGIFLPSICGGRKTCGRCKIQVISGKVSSLSDSERAHLGVEELSAGFRLACATQVFSNLKLHIPVTSLLDVQHLQTFKQKSMLVREPKISVYKIKLSKPPRKIPEFRWDKLQKELKKLYGLENLTVASSVRQNISQVLQNSKSQVKILVRNNEVISILPYGCELLGMAIDLGTTTIMGCLVNLYTGETLTVQTVMNPQVSYGEDIMSRISFAMEGNGNILRKIVVEAINRIISEAVNDPEEIVRVTIDGNTAMHHLLLGLPVKQLGTAPYKPAICHSMEIEARDLNLSVSPETYVYFLPNIAGFVGGDHVGMILSTGIDKTDKNVIGIDIGTNTEVTLATKNTLTSLSCASGPAFEGAGISHGMRATSGAIAKVRIDDDGIHLKVIDDERPIGICGSGILDTLSELRRWHIIDSRGVLVEHPRVRQVTHGHEFVLAPGDITGTGQDIVITQRDIGEIQLAKAAIRTGINILLSDADIKENEIDEIIVAGAFGYSMNPASAINIGLFTPLPADRFKQVGNAAAAGAQLTLFSEKERAIAEEIAKRVNYIELTTHPEFTRQFAHALRFPQHVNDEMS